eukprot:7984681-Karenia_brevis.AAC.1
MSSGPLPSTAKVLGPTTDLTLDRCCMHNVRPTVLRVSYVMPRGRTPPLALLKAMSLSYESKEMRRGDKDPLAKELQ